jgi:di/tricarboxylate transporter
VTDAAIVYVVLAGLVILFVWNKFPPDLVALSAPIALLATGVIDVDEAFAGFGDTTVIFIASLFIVSEGLDSTGVTTWAGQRMVALAGESTSRLTVVMMVIVAVLAALIGVNGAVAALVPMVVLVAIRMSTPPSRLLMPLAFGAHAGSQLALTGSPIHILVSDATVQAGEPGFEYFDFTMVGLFLVIGAIAIALLTGRRLIPDREPVSLASDLSEHALTLIEHYDLEEWATQLEIPKGSRLVGRPVTELDTEPYPGLRIDEVVGKLGTIEPSTPMPEGAVISVVGTARQIEAFTDAYGLSRRPSAMGGPGSLLNRRTGVVELMIPPRSPMVGEHIFPGEATRSGDFVILALRREGESIGEEGTKLKAGDTVLLQGTWEALERFDPSNALVVDHPDQVRRQALPLGPGSRRAILITLGMVALLATGIVSPVIAAVLAAGALVVTRVITMRQAYRAVNWTIVVMVAALFPLSVAIERSGVAEDIAGGLVDLVGDAGPHALLLGLFIITALFGQLISNTATALIMIPVAVTAAIDFGISVQPVMMSLTVASAAAFLTPIATAANLMIMEPGGYEFRDYWKFGLLMLLLFMAASVLLVPVFWPF